MCIKKGSFDFINTIYHSLTVWQIYLCICSKRKYFIATTKSMKSRRLQIGYRCVIQQNVVLNENLRWIIANLSGNISVRNTLRWEQVILWNQWSKRRIPLFLTLLPSPFFTLFFPPFLSTHTQNHCQIKGANEWRHTGLRLQLWWVRSSLFTWGRFQHCYAPFPSLFLFCFYFVQWKYNHIWRPGLAALESAEYSMKL